MLGMVHFLAEITFLFLDIIGAEMGDPRICLEILRQVIHVGLGVQAFRVMRQLVAVVMGVHEYTLLVMAAMSCLSLYVFLHHGDLDARIVVEMERWHVHRDISRVRRA